MTNRCLPIIALALALGACDGGGTTSPVETDPVQVTVTSPVAQIEVGRTITLAAQVRNTSNSAVTWRSSNAATALVTSSGDVTGVAPGSVRITAVSQADTTKSGGVDIVVSAPVGISVAPASVPLSVGQTQQLTATVTNSANSAVTWQSSAPAVATVSGSGLVTAVGAGSATILVTSVADPTRTAQATVTVTAPSFQLTAATTLVVEQGQAASLPITIARSSGHISAITWTSTGATGVTRTITPSPAPGSATSATLNVSALTSAIAQTSALVVTGTDASGVQRSVTVQLTILPVGGAATQVLVSGTPLTNIGGAEDSGRFFRITVPQGATRLDVRTSGGIGDMDLYINDHTFPTSIDIECSSEGDTNDELCTINNPAPGVWFVLLVGFTDYSGVTLTSTVNAATPSFTLSMTPSTVSIAPGGSATFTISVARSSGHSGNIDLTAENLPAGVTATFTPSVLTGTQSTATLVLAAAAAAPGGTATMTVRARSTSLPDRTVTAAVTVSAPGIALGLQGSTVSMLRGVTGTMTVGITRIGGYTGAVTLTISGLPSGVSATFSPATLSATQTQSTLTFTSSSTATPGVSNLTVRAAGTGVADATVPLVLTVTGPQPAGIATFTELSIPGVPAGGASNLQTTNQGVYLQVLPANGDDMTVLKLTPGPSADWMTWRPGFFLADWSPSSPYNERSREFNIYWTKIGINAAIGNYNMNNGAPSFQWWDNLNLDNYISDRSTLGRSWAINDRGYVYLQGAGSVGGPAGDSTRSRYQRVDSVPKFPWGNEVDFAISEDDDLALYVAYGDTLYRFTSSGIDRRHNLAALGGGSGSVTRMLWADGKLYIGYNGRVLKLDGQALSVVATMQGGVPIFANSIPFFCLAAGNVYLSDGMRYPTSGLGSPASWLGTTTGITDQTTLANFEILKARVGGSEMHCLQNTVSSSIYALNQDKLMVISPR